MYIEMPTKAAQSLPELPCACANIRRAARAATRMYNRELRPSELELTQYTLLMALDLTGEITQKGLGELLAMDSTTLTRTLSFLARRGWIREKAGDDRRQKLISLTADGRRKLQRARPHWERAQKKLRTSLGDAAWQQMGRLLGAITAASSCE